MLLVCIAVLARLQLLPSPDYIKEISEFKQARNRAYQLKTIRGKILDRNHRIIAADEAKFELNISYGLTKYADPRVVRAMRFKAAKDKTENKALDQLQQRINSKFLQIENVIEKCVQLGYSREQIISGINQINERIWNSRSFVAWRRNFLNEDIVTKYGSLASVPLSVAMEDFEKNKPDEDDRILLTAAVTDIVEMKKDCFLTNLEDDENVFIAQSEFMDIEGVSISAKPGRSYPYKSIACQTIGWVGSASGVSQHPFTDDRLKRYLANDVCGREDGVEYVCEGLLRGKRGELVYDIDGNVIAELPTDFGDDVVLTLDMELTKNITERLKDPDFNQNYNSSIAAVVIDVNSSEVLSLVSLPDYDINRIRYDYGKLLNDPCVPLINRCINKQYPPGSVIKPLILLAGLETEKVGVDEVISCPAHEPPKGWPACWLQKKYSCHDDKWPNNGTNAIKGSCNIYFSRLANRLDSRILQKYLFAFGYGRPALSVYEEVQKAAPARNFRQAAGIIYSGRVRNTIEDFNDLSALRDSEKRWFGIGQGNCRTTPLQVANTMATLSRGGIFKKPILFKGQATMPEALNIKPQTLQIVRKGMYAVVNQSDGTAYKELRSGNFAGYGITVYGKTGSTEGPYHAWFAGFAEDETGRKIAFSVIVEGGAHGSSDAGPLAREMVSLCIEAGYIGTKKHK